VSTYIDHLSTKCHEPVSSGLLSVAIRSKAKQSLVASGMLLFYLFQSKCLNETCMLFKHRLRTIQ
jgi:hypothetical protein